MEKLRHKWVKIDGFRTHACSRCGKIRYWDNTFHRIMYKTKFKIWYYETPECVSTMHCDKVEKPEQETINFLKHKNFIA